MPLRTRLARSGDLDEAVRVLEETTAMFFQVDLERLVPTEEPVQISPRPVLRAHHRFSLLPRRVRPQIA
jgi:hypothetical protein